MILGLAAPSLREGIRRAALERMRVPADAWAKIMVKTAHNFIKRKIFSEKVPNNLKNLLLALPLCRQLKFVPMFWRQDRENVYEDRTCTERDEGSAWTSTDAGDDCGSDHSSVSDSADTLMLPGGGPGDDPDRLDWWYPPIWELQDLYYFSSLPMPNQCLDNSGLDGGNSSDDVDDDDDDGSHGQPMKRRRLDVD
eukprot:s316_g3.t1